MKKLVLFSLGLILCLTAFAQSELSELAKEQSELNQFINASGNGRLYLFNQGVKEVEGSPYLTEGIILGEILTKNETFLTNTAYKYNIHEDCIEMTKEGRRINIFAHQIRSFSFFDPIENRKRFFRNGFHNYQDNYTSITYYEVLYDGKVKLIRKYDKPIMRVGSKINVPGMNTNTATKRYSQIVRTYIKKGSEYIPVKLTRPNIKRALNSSELKAHLKETKNKCRTLEDVKKALAFYDSTLPDEEKTEK